MRALAAALLAGSAALADTSGASSTIHPARLKPVKEFRIPGGFGRFDLSGDGRFLSNLSGNTLTLFSTAGGQKLCELDTDHERGVHDSALSYDGSLYATLGNDAVVKIWNLRTGKEIGSFATGAGYSCSAAFTRDGKYLLADDGKRSGLVIWDVSGNREEKRHNVCGTSYTFISPNGRYAVVSAGRTNIVDLRTGALVKEIAPQTLATFAMSPDSKRVAGRDMDGRLRVWDLETGAELTRSSVEAAGLAYTPDGRYLAVTSGDGRVRFLETRSMKEAHVVRLEDVEEGAGKVYYQLAFTRDGRMVAAEQSGKILVLR